MDTEATDAVAAELADLEGQIVDLEGQVYDLIGERDALRADLAHSDRVVYMLKKTLSAYSLPPQSRRARPVPSGQDLDDWQAGAELERP